MVNISLPFSICRVTWARLWLPSSQQVNSLTSATVFVGRRWTNYLAALYVLSSSYQTGDVYSDLGLIQAVNIFLKISLHRYLRAVLTLIRKQFLSLQLCQRCPSHSCVPVICSGRDDSVQRHFTVSLFHHFEFQLNFIYCVSDQYWSLCRYFCRL